MSRHVVVVGAGPAGLSAAAAALRAGADVTLLDGADQPGGQYHRMLPAAYSARNPERVQHDWPEFVRRRDEVLGHHRCAWRPETSVWALERRDSAPPRVHVVDARGRTAIEPDALVLATGAHDRVLPFPGWTLPGVYTAGAAQALAKGERVVVGDRVVVGGTGPFLLPVAAALSEAGSRVLAVIEANQPARIARGWAGRPAELLPHAGKAAELASYALGQLRHRVPYRAGWAIVEARGDGRVEETVIARVRADWSVVPGTELSTAVDAVCVGHGFTAQLELPVAAGCALRAGGDAVLVDDDQATSQSGVYAAGEITGIAGAPAARDEGTVAGWMAAGGVRPTMRGARRARDRGRAFARRLAAAHPIGAGWSSWLRDDTIVCRCEEVEHATLTRALSDPLTAGSHAVKLCTRAGLGPCQGRICGPTVAELASRAGRTVPSPHGRPIAQPIRLGDLARRAEETTD